jgi:predicted RNase H-like nuclease (RuvC/YqgF family)
MKFEEVLKAQGLTDEQITAIIGAMTENKIFTTTEEKIEERYEKLKIKKEALQEELTEANTTITTLKKDNKGNEDLQAKVKEYEDTIATLKKDNDAKTFDMALELELTKSNAKKTKAVKALLDLEKVKQKEDGTFEGLTDQLEELKKSDAYLFNTGEVKPNYNPVAAGQLQLET